MLKLASHIKQVSTKDMVTLLHDWRRWWLPWSITFVAFAVNLSLWLERLRGDGAKMVMSMNPLHASQTWGLHQPLILDKNQGMCWYNKIDFQPLKTNEYCIMYSQGRLASLLLPVTWTIGASGPQPICTKPKKSIKQPMRSVANKYSTPHEKFLKNL